MTNHRQSEYVSTQKQLEKELAERKRKAYLDPAKALEHKNKGNDLFKAGKNEMERERERERKGEEGEGGGRKRKRKREKNKRRKKKKRERERERARCFPPFTNGLLQCTLNAFLFLFLSYSLPLIFPFPSLSFPPHIRGFPRG